MTKRPTSEPEPENDKFDGEGIIDEENPQIVTTIQSMLKQGYSDVAIKRIVGCTQKMIDHHKEVLAK